MLLLPRLALGAFLLLFGATGLAAPAVLVSVKPLQMLAAGVMEGIAAPELLIPAGASPHGYALKPSQVLRLGRASVVFWFGPTLESQLAAHLRVLPAGVRVETVLDWPALEALPARGTAHDHGAVDAHLWLDPRRAARLALRMAEVLAAVDGAHGERYRANGRAVAERLAVLDAEIAERLRPVADRPLWVYHDGYQYFERRYGLRLAGALNQNPEQPLKPAALLRLEAEPAVRCLFLDAQYRNSSPARMLAGMNLRLVELDPLGRDAAADLAGYESLMRGMAEAFAGCLGTAGEG
jgi:zinc transport system substrate-binding protein